MKTLATYRTTISTELMTKLQQVSYDLEQHERNLRLLIKEGVNPNENEAYKFYSNEATILNAELNLIKSEIEENTLPQLFSTRHQCNVYMVYSTNEIIVEIYCACGVKELEDAGYVLEK